MQQTFNPLSQKGFQLVERGILCLNEEGKFTFTPRVSENAVFILVDKTYKKMHPRCREPYNLSKPKFEEILSELVRNKLVTETTVDNKFYIRLSREGEYELLRCFLKEV